MTSRFGITGPVGQNRVRQMATSGAMLMSTIAVLLQLQHAQLHTRFYRVVRLRDDMAGVTSFAPFLVVCDVDTGNVSSTPETNAECSPRWVVYPNSRADGARYNAAAKTARECLDACAVNASCVAVEWNGRGSRRCLVHSERRPRVYHPYVTQFETVR